MSSASGGAKSALAKACGNRPPRRRAPLWAFPRDEADRALTRGEDDSSLQKSETMLFCKS
jgi:hypothetical protein